MLVHRALSTSKLHIYFSVIFLAIFFQCISYTFFCWSGKWSIGVSE